MSKAGNVVLCEPLKTKEVPLSDKGSPLADVHSIVKIMNPLLSLGPAAATAPFPLPKYPSR